MIIGKGYTNQGGREYNEDTGTFAKKDGFCYAVMADGLGGHGNGDVASKTAVNTVRECIHNMPKNAVVTEEDMIEWFDRANQSVLVLQNDQCHMKTTLALLCVDEKRETAHIAHLGDSRVYHFEDGRCVFYTFDHSVSRMAVLAGEIAIEDIRHHADRSKLLKAIGKSEDVKAETKTIALDKNAEHAFLLCTDGFWEYVTEAEMEKTLASAKSPEEWIHKMRKYIKKKAKDGNDNNSAIAIWVI